MLTVKEFTNQLLDLRHQYRADNQWVAGWAQWDDDKKMEDWIAKAYSLYAATARNALRMTVLGGTGIRMDDKYVPNFGVTAATGIQDPETRNLVKAEFVRRFASRRAPAPQATRPDRSYTPVIGSGSILSERGWTPILNDALILGAITGRQEFVLGLTVDEQQEWDRMNGGRVNRVATLTARYGPTPTLMNAWKEFLNSQVIMFFDAGRNAPRVFAREILGLSFFGYEPIFSWHQLGFRPANPAMRPDFRNYLNRLHQLRFHVPDRVAILEAISLYLFNDRDAIRPPGAPPIPNPP